MNLLNAKPAATMDKVSFVKELWSPSAFFPACRNHAAPSCPISDANLLKASFAASAV